MTINRNNAECHMKASAKMARAVRMLEDAMALEDGLEWSGAIASMIEEAKHIEAKLREYAWRARESKP